jgi:hypothetical protein
MALLDASLIKTEMTTKLFVNKLKIRNWEPIHNAGMVSGMRRGTTILVAKDILKSITVVNIVIQCFWYQEHLFLIKNLWVLCTFAF